MSTAQIVFSIALAVVGITIVSFALYVLNTTTWADRWVRRSRSLGDTNQKAAQPEKGAA